MRSMVEGHARVIPTSPVRPASAWSPPFTLVTTRACPSTTFGGPPPRAGEELRLSAPPAKARGL